MVALLPAAQASVTAALEAVLTVAWSWDLADEVRFEGFLDPWPGNPPTSLAQLLEWAHVQDREVLAKVLARAKASKEPFAHDFRVGGLKSERWVNLRGGATTTALGSVVVAGTCHDTTTLVTARELLARRGASKWGDGWLAVNRDWEVEHVNASAAAFLGSGAAELLHGSLWAAPCWAHVDPGARIVLEEAMSTSTPADVEVESGASGRFEVRSFPGAGGMTLHLRNVDERVALEVARAEADERQARAQGRLELLSQASGALGQRLRRTSVVDAAVALAVPALADWALVYLEEGGVLRRAAMEHRDPSKKAVADSLLRAAPVPLGMDTQLTRTFRTGHLEHAVFNPEEDALRTPHEKAFVALVRQLGEPVEALSVPLRVGTSVVGVLILTSLDRSYDHEDLELAEEYARRVGSALGNATRFEREHSATVALQDSLLPRDLVQLEHADLAALYLPAEQETGVGGDWYDAFELSGSCVGFTVGDITGHGVSAAAAMCQMRNSLAAYAFEGHGPSAVMERLDALRARAGEAGLATAVYAVLDTETGVLTWVSAGHPPMLVVRAEGVELLDESPNSLLGLGMGLGYVAGTTQLKQGDVVLAYSDGLVERRGEDLDDSTARLVDAAQAAWTMDLTTRLERVVEAVLGGRGREDDVCLLAVRWH